MGEDRNILVPPLRSGPGLEQHYAIQEVAEALGVSYDTVWRACVKGELRSVRLGAKGRERHIPASAIEEWCRDGADMPPAGRVVAIDRRRTA